MLDGSTWDAIALYDITRRAVRGDLLGRLLPACHFALKMLKERKEESIRRIVSSHKADAMWTAWQQRFVNKYGDKKFFENRDASYHDAVTADFLAKELPSRATRLILGGSSVALGFTLEAEQMWQLMERRFGFSRTDLHRTEVAIFDDSLMNPKEAAEAIFATLRPVREWIKNRNVSVYVLMPGRTLLSSSGQVASPTGKQWVEFWTNLSEIITKEDEARALCMARPCFLLPLVSGEVQYEVEAVVNYGEAFSGTIVIFSPEMSQLWNAWERDAASAGAPSNAETIQLWSFGFLQIARAILLNYFSKVTLGEQFWIAVETTEDVRTLKALGA